MAVLGSAPPRPPQEAAAGAAPRAAKAWTVLMAAEMQETQEMPAIWAAMPEEETPVMVADSSMDYLTAMVADFLMACLISISKSSGQKLCR